MGTEEEEQAEGATEDPKPKKAITDYLPWRFWKPPEWWQNPTYRFAFFLVLVTTLLAIATFGLWWATRDLVLDARESGDKQLRAMREQLNEMKASGKQTDDLIKAAQASAKAAQDALTLSENTAKRQLRAYLFPDAFKGEVIKQKMVLTAYLKNTGQTPAFNVTANGLLSIEKDGVIVRQSPIISKNDHGSYGRDSIFVIKTEFDITEDFAEDLRSGRIIVRFNGNASYIDVFDESHPLPFNFYIRPFASGSLLMTKDGGADERKQKEENMPEPAH